LTLGRTSMRRLEAWPTATASRATGAHHLRTGRHPSLGVSDTRVAHGQQASALTAGMGLAESSKLCDFSISAVREREAGTMRCPLQPVSHGSRLTAPGRFMTVANCSSRGRRALRATSRPGGLRRDGQRCIARTLGRASDAVGSRRRSRASPGARRGIRAARETFGNRSAGHRLQGLPCNEWTEIIASASRRC
jgi:hypothetical protein